jgi:hypothetical protein
MNARRLLETMLLAATSSFVAGCGVPLASPDENLVNGCETEADCGGGGVCVDAICVATKADLAGMLLQVDLPSTASFAPGSSRLVTPADEGVALQGNNGAGYYVPFAVDLGEQVEVEVMLEVTPVPAGCEPLAAGVSDDSFPVSVQLYPSLDPVGIPLPVYKASSELTSEGHRARLSVPPGDYDIYVVPEVETADGTPVPECLVPTSLLRGRNVASGNVSVSVSLGQPQTLTGEISGLDLGEWTIDLAENVFGRRISTESTLETQAANEPSQFSLNYWPQLAAEEDVDLLVRLRPPDNEEAAAMPTILWRLDAVDLDGDNAVSLDVSALAAAELIELKGSALDVEQLPVPATVAIQSTELLDGKFGGNAAFKTTVNSDENGDFAVSLLPGVYRVTAVPTGDPNLAITTDVLTLKPGDLGAGKTIEINPKTLTEGSALTPLGEPAADLSVTLQPSTPPVASYLEAVLNTSDVLPAGATGVTSASGAFSVDLDPGVFDMTLQPAEGSGYPWLARPRITVQPNDDPGKLAFGALALSNPVVLRGRVTAPGPNGATPVAGAFLRAWLPPPSPEDRGDRPTVIQIGEAISDANGNYTLLVPSSTSQ